MNQIAVALWCFLGGQVTVRVRLIWSNSIDFFQYEHWAANICQLKCGLNSRCHWPGYLRSENVSCFCLPSFSGSRCEGTPSINASILLVLTSLYNFTVFDPCILPDACPAGFACNQDPRSLDAAACYCPSDHVQTVDQSVCVPGIYSRLIAIVCSLTLFSFFASQQYTILLHIRSQVKLRCQWTRVMPPSSVWRVQSDRNISSRVVRSLLCQAHWWLRFGKLYLPLCLLSVDTVYYM